jgi:hypothetical protein
VWSNPVPGWARLGLAALVGMAFFLVGLLWWAYVRTPAVDAGDLAANSPVPPGAEVIVTGEWVISTPAEHGHLVVVLRGRAGGQVVCHFEDVPAIERGELERRLLRAGVVAVRGRYDGQEEGRPALRVCRLLE